MNHSIITYNPEEPASLKEFCGKENELREKLVKMSKPIKKSDLKKKRKLEQVPEVIRQIARKAYAATQNHYGWPDAFTGGDLDKAELHVQLHVIRDVKAVILGNRTAGQLHENWRYCKLKARCSGVTRYNYINCDHYHLQEGDSETIITPWNLLSTYDQKGYELFVETVKQTYEALTAETKQESVPKSPAVALLSAASKAIAAHKSSMGGVSVFFDSKEDEEAFLKAVENAKQ